MYKGNKISYDNLNEKLKGKISKADIEIVNDLTTGGIDKVLSAEQGKKLDIMVNEHVAELKPKVDNSWQKGVYNDTDIMNLKAMSVSKVFYISGNDWKSTTNVEVLDFNIPLENFSGVIKVTFATSGITTVSAGGAEVIYNIGKYSSNIQNNEMAIISLSPKFSDFYRIRNAVIYDGFVTIGLLKSPSANNAMSVKIELLGTYSQIFDALKSTGAITYDTGEPNYGGYPWTPQTSNIPTSHEKAVWNMKMNGGWGYQFGDDVNLLTGSGIYATTGAGINLPSEGGDGWSTVIMLPPMPDNPERAVQLCYKWNDTTSGRSLHFRTVNNGNFSSWSRILHQVDYDKLFTLFGDKNVKIASAITDKGVPTNADATGDTMAANIRSIPRGKKVVEGYMNIPAFSGGQRVSVDVPVGFLARNAMSAMGGRVLIGGYEYGTHLTSGPYVDNIQIIGNTVRFNYAMGSSLGSWVGGGAYYAITS